MSAIATSLALEVLTCGTLVDNVSVYGIVVMITDLQHIRLIKTKLELQHRPMHLYEMSQGV